MAAVDLGLLCRSLFGRMGVGRSRMIYLNRDRFGNLKAPDHQGPKRRSRARIHVQIVSQQGVAASGERDCRLKGIGEFEIVICPELSCLWSDDTIDVHKRHVGPGNNQIGEVLLTRHLRLSHRPNEAFCQSNGRSDPQDHAGVNPVEDLVYQGGIF